MTAPPPVESPEQVEIADSGLMGLCGIAAYFRIAAEPPALRRQLALSGERRSGPTELIRAARIIGLKAGIGAIAGEKGLASLAAPSLVARKDGSFVIFGGRQPSGLYRLIDPVTRIERNVDPAEFFADFRPEAIRIARRLFGKGVIP